EGMTLELVNSLYPGKFWKTLAAARHDEVVSRHPIAAVGLDQPFAFVLDPPCAGDGGLKACLLLKAVVLADLSTELERLRRIRIAMLRSVVEFLKQRQVDVRLDIALRAGIAVPIPGHPEVAAIICDPNVAKSRMMKTCTCQKSAESAARDDHLGMIGKG